MDIMDIRITDDYASVQGDGFSFYYGNMPTLENEWCFRAKLKGMAPITIPVSELSDYDGDCVETLLLGIGKLIDDGVLVPNTGEKK